MLGLKGDSHTQQQWGSPSLFTGSLLLLQQCEGPYKEGVRCSFEAAVRGVEGTVCVDASCQNPMGAGCCLQGNTQQCMLQTSMLKVLWVELLARRSCSIAVPS
jgi:hypothetical protein